jgi:tetratricopeptide (TPR) repeat protein
MAMSKRDRKQRKKKARQERLRKEKHTRHYGPEGPDDLEDEEIRDYGPEEPELDLPPATAFERALRPRPSLLGRLFGARRAEIACDQAQELAYDAMEESDPERATELAGRALALDPDCSDALYVLALNAAGSRQEQIDLLEQAVAAAERRLGGPSFFEENQGSFWAILETRPYMRARAALADILRGEGRLAEAMGHYKALLSLNPNDNQGLRDVLLGCFLRTGDLEGARCLLERYVEDHGAVFSYGRVLERFLAGDLEGAARARQDARQVNPHVEGYLTGRKSLPCRPPEWCSPGDENEAVHCAIYMTDAWRQNPCALAWLNGLRG